MQSFTARGAPKVITYRHMSAKYYTHFIAQQDGAVDYSEYRGVVELLGQPSEAGDEREIARVLARSFDLEERDIQVLQWHQLH